MHRTCLLTFVLMSSALFVKAAGLGTSREFLVARQALADGLPEVAALKAERLLPLKTWTRAETRQLATFAAEAWTRASNAPRVLKLAEAHDLEEETFWRAQALVLEGDLAAAREELASSKEARGAKARLLLAQILTALGEHDAAHDEIEPLTTTGSAEERRHANLLLAEIEINSGRVHAALQRLGDGAGTDDPAASLLRARGHLLSNDGKLAREE
ncbi:MAG: hypothetical protein JNG86_04160, partial [Verrucomicrobiaceae bacterium]|nr:hypothetical protein [Verrucomicrobiaceae bacterium]